MESTFHIFAKCPKLIPIWEVMDDSIIACFENKCKYSFKIDRYQKCHFDLVNSRCQKQYENLILYLNAVINHNIWKKRNKIFHENESFDCFELLNKVCASLRGRETMEKNKERLKQGKKVDFLHEYYVTLVSIKDAMFDPG